MIILISITMRQSLAVIIIISGIIMTIISIIMMPSLVPPRCYQQYRHHHQYTIHLTPSPPPPQDRMKEEKKRKEGGRMALPESVEQCQEEGVFFHGNQSHLIQQSVSHGEEYHHSCPSSNFHISLREGKPSKFNVSFLHR